MLPRAIGVFGISCILALSTGCSTMKYLVQATRGQLELMNKAKPISEVLKDERTSPRVRELLTEISPIKKYGESEGLKPTSNYIEYVKLNRPAAVWVVSACDRLQFKSREWHFPIVGDFPYLGWFNLDQAKDFAQELRREDLDVDLRGAGAYSTLGYFRDAVLSTMISDGDEALGDLVNVVLHESVHATVYIKGQAYFNESLASFVADHLTPRYLDQRPAAKPATAQEKTELAATGSSEARESRPSHERASYAKAEAQYEIRRQRLHEAYEKLNTLYASAATPEEKLAKKKEYLTQLQAELGFRREINNATLIQYKTYSTGQPEFEKIWKACNADGKRFMSLMAKLKSDSFQSRQQEDLSTVLLPLLNSGC